MASKTQNRSNTEPQGVPEILDYLIRISVGSSFRKRGRTQSRSNTEPQGVPEILD